MVPAAPLGERLEKRLEPLECEVVAGEQPDQVPGLEPEPVAEGAAQGSGLRDLEPARIDRVGNDVDPVQRNAVILFQMPFHHVADGDDARLPRWDRTAGARSAGAPSAWDSSSWPRGRAAERAGRSAVRWRPDCRLARRLAG